MLSRILTISAGIVTGAAILLAGLLIIAILLTYPRLPDLDILTDYRPKIPLRVYTQDKVLIGEFGEERRSFVRIDNVPYLHIGQGRKRYNAFSFQLAVSYIPSSCCHES